VFAPSVGRFAQGMLIQLPLPLWAIDGAPAPADLLDALRDAYTGEQFIEVLTAEEAASLQARRATASGYVAELDPEGLNGSNRLRIVVFGSRDGRQAMLVAILDNLGKGAAGAAVQNMNLMLGLEESRGLG
jgi:N-acetyl-gamma-glutamyl-phosphate reductase